MLAPGSDPVAQVSVMTDVSPDKPFVVRYGGGTSVMMPTWDLTP